MSGTQRRIDRGVAQQVLGEPHRFEFFQAIRVLERVLKADTPERARVVEEHLRFQNSLGLGFPASELEPAVEVFLADGARIDSDVGLEDALRAHAIGRIQMTPLFMGLLGTSGALPLHYTETVQRRELFARDRAARAFLDVFSTRAVSLHYAAWKKHRLAIQYELDRRERFLPLVLALVGLGQGELHDRMCEEHGKVFDHAVGYYAGLLRQRPVSSVVIQKLLSDYFDVPFTVEQFVGAWYRLPDGEETQLGRRCARLGVDALAGTRVWQRSLRLRLRIGPLSQQRFDAFLPGGTAAIALARWLALLTSGTLEFEVRLVLCAAEVAGSGVGAGHTSRLGWDSYMTTRPQALDRDDTRYQVPTS